MMLLARSTAFERGPRKGPAKGHQAPMKKPPAWTPEARSV